VKLNTRLHVLAMLGMNGAMHSVPPYAFMAYGEGGGDFTPTNILHTRLECSRKLQAVRKTGIQFNLRPLLVKQ
jgi:hypothetical protein